MEGDVMTDLNIYQRLLKITEEAEKIPKNGYNNFSKYNYVVAADLFNHIKPLMVKYGVHDTLAVKSSARSQYGKNFHTELDCVGTFINIDKPDERHVVDCRGVAADTLDKDTPKAYTSARKNLYTSEFNIITADVQDIEGQTKPQGDNDNVNLITESQYVDLRSLCEEAGWPVDETLNRLAKRFNIKKIEDLPASQYKDAVEVINAAKK